MNHDDYDDKYLISVLKDAKTVAMVALVPIGMGPAICHEIHAAKGFRVIPVNPGVAGQEILGETVMASLDEIDDYRYGRYFPEFRSCGPHHRRCH